MQEVTTRVKAAWVRAEVRLPALRDVKSRCLKHTDGNVGRGTHTPVGYVSDRTRFLRNLISLDRLPVEMHAAFTH